MDVPEFELPDRNPPAAGQHEQIFDHVFGGEHDASTQDRDENSASGSGDPLDLSDISDGPLDRGPVPVPADWRGRSYQEEYANSENDIPLAPQVHPGIEHRYTTRQIVEALAATTPSGLVDESALPKRLAAKRTKNADTGTPYIAPATHTPMTGAEWTLVAALPVSWAASTTLLATHFAPTTVDVLVVLITVLITASALTLKFRPDLRPSQRRALDGYTPNEHAELERAVADWPGRGRLSDYVNGEALRSQFDTRWPWAGHRGAPAAVWREPHLVGIATLIADAIRSSTAWNSELFDTHRVRIDLDATLRDIRLRAHRIWRIQADTVTTDESTGPVADRHREITAAVDDAWDKLVALVGELDDYRMRLAPIDALVDEINSLQLSSERVSDDALRQLHIDAAGSDFKRDAIAATSDELSELTANLNGRLDAMRAALNQPAAVLTLA